MEPRPHERGNNQRSMPNFKAVYGFNGATSSRTWKRELFDFTEEEVDASMEPRPHERGNKPYEYLSLPL